jgi:transmembrane sensor
MMPPRPSAAIRAEAAAWVARLHGPQRNAEVEAGLRRWLAETPAHAAAFELVSDAWEKSASLHRNPIEEVSSWQRSGFRITLSRAALSAALTIALAVIASAFYFHSDALTTGIGELRTVTLNDGTRVHLNTDTRVRVRYDKQLRRVYLERGEALFEVAKRPDWPFIVTAGNHQIRALGTAFIVRSEKQHLVVTLVEGKVTVIPVGSPIRSTQSTSSAEPRLTSPSTGSRQTPDVVVLSAGQRLTLAGDGPPEIDRAAIERVTAWERGQVALDNTSLADAVAELNRYSRERIVIDDASLAAIHVSGVFQAGDSPNFAAAVARTFHLTIANHGGEIHLTAVEVNRSN